MYAADCCGSKVCGVSSSHLASCALLRRNRCCSAMPVSEVLTSSGMLADLRHRNWRLQLRNHICVACTRQVITCCSLGNCKGLQIAMMTTVADVHACTCAHVPENGGLVWDNVPAGALDVCAGTASMIKLPPSAASHSAAHPQRVCGQHERRSLQRRIAHHEHTVHLGDGSWMCPVL